MNSKLKILPLDEFIDWVEKLYEDTKGGDRIYMTRSQWNWFVSMISKHTSGMAALQDQIKAYKLAIERGQGNDCPPDGDVMASCQLDNDCTACWAKYLLGLYDQNPLVVDAPSAVEIDLADGKLHSLITIEYEDGRKVMHQKIYDLPELYSGKLVSMVVFKSNPCTKIIPVEEEEK